MKLFINLNHYKYANLIYMKNKENIKLTQYSPGAG